MSKQIISYGAVNERSTDGGTTWVRIPECDAIAVPTDEPEYVDVTSLDSPNGRREFLVGLTDGGVITLPCGYTSAGYEMHAADKALGVPILYRTTLKTAPDQATGDVFEYSGFPNPSVEPGGVGDPIKMNVAIRTTGAVTWTKGTAA